MIKNKMLDIKIIFKILKIFEVSKHTLILQNSKNSFQKPFLIIVFENHYQTNPQLAGNSKIKIGKEKEKEKLQS